VIGPRRAPRQSHPVYKKFRLPLPRVRAMTRTIAADRRRRWPIRECRPISKTKKWRSRRCRRGRGLPRPLPRHLGKSSHDQMQNNLEVADNSGAAGCSGISAGRVEAEIRDGGRRHRRLGQDAISGAARSEKKGDVHQRSFVTHGQGRFARTDPAARSASTATRRC